MIRERWRRLWRHRVRIGDPFIPATWVDGTYANFRDEFPPFEWGRIVLTSGGFRILLFRWLVMVDPWTNLAHYQQLFWLEFVPRGGGPGFLRGRHLAIHLVLPPERGRLSICLALSGDFLANHGLFHTEWEDWSKEDNPIDDGLTAGP